MCLHAISALLPPQRMPGYLQIDPAKHADSKRDWLLHGERIIRSDSKWSQFAAQSICATREILSMTLWTSASGKPDRFMYHEQTDTRPHRRVQKICCTPAREHRHSGCDPARLRPGNAARMGMRASVTTLAKPEHEMTGLLPLRTNVLPMLLDVAMLWVQKDRNCTSWILKYTMRSFVFTTPATLIDTDCAHSCRRAIGMKIPGVSHKSARRPYLRLNTVLQTTLRKLPYIYQE